MKFVKWSDIKIKDSGISLTEYSFLNALEKLNALRGQLGVMESFIGEEDIRYQLADTISKTGMALESFVILEARWTQYQIRQEQVEKEQEKARQETEDVESAE